MVRPVASRSSALQPFLSGHDALTSLTRYAPSNRLKEPVSRPKVAELAQIAKANIAAVTLQKLATHNSGLVDGFLLKCAEAGLSPQKTILVIQHAMRIHPNVAAEFMKCGMLKQAIGGPGIPGMKNPLTTPAAPPKPPAMPAGPPGGVMPASQENMFTAPFNAARELFSGGPVAQHAFGFSKMTPQGDSVPNVQPASAPGPSLAERGIGVTRSALSGLGALPAVGVDAARGIGTGNWNMDYSKMMGRSLLSGVNRNLGTNIGHDVEARPAGNFGKTDIGPDAGRGFFGNGVDQSTGQPSLGALPAAAKYHAEQSRLPNAEGGTPLSRIGSSIAAPAFDYAEPALTMGMGAKAVGGRLPGEGMPLRQLATGAATTAGLLGLPQASEELFQDPQIAERQRTADIAGMRGEQPPAQPDGEGQSVVAQLPMYQKIQNWVQQAPEQAKQFGQQAMQQLSSAFQTDPGKAEASAVQQTGGLTPDGQKTALTALSSEGYDMKQAASIFQNMNGWEQLGLWGGIGLSALGLLHAMSGGSGISSLMMSLLGLGVAGFTAGKAGLLDQGAKDLTGGLSDATGAMTGQNPQQEVPAGIKQLLPNLLQENVPDAALSPLLQQVPSMYPDAAKQLDQAAGTGSWGNSVMGWLGDMTGQRQKMMQDKLGLNPQQQDRLLKLWASQRNAGR